MYYIYIDGYGLKVVEGNTYRMVDRRDATIFESEQEARNFINNNSVWSMFQICEVRKV